MDTSKIKLGENVWVLDNNGKSFDRYTVIYSDKSIHGASSDPYHPQGFGQYCGDVQGSVKRYISYMTHHQGERLVKKLENLPEQVIKFILQRLPD